MLLTMATRLWLLFWWIVNPAVILQTAHAYCPRDADKDQRVRREIRDLSEAERNRVFDAMKEMKTLSTAEGQGIYGNDFVSYDELIAKHILASAAGPACDQAHFGSGFGPYHRTFTAMFENSLLAIDSDIQAMPYWDYNIDAELDDPRTSLIWEWFGSSEGDPNDQHNVNDGEFQDWTVPSGEDALELLGDGTVWSAQELVNPHGFLRAPWNRNPSNKITRLGKHCGSETKFNTKMWNVCLGMPDYLTWQACIDVSVHSWAHSFIGGIWGEGRDKDRSLCLATYSVAVPLMFSMGCVNCPTECTKQEGCSCSLNFRPFCIANDMKHLDFGDMWAQEFPRMTYADYADVWASPNDPIFFFHHANVDRHLMTWQHKTFSESQARVTNYNFPTESIPCEGHGLDDTIAKASPFDGSVLGMKEGVLLTNRDVIHCDGRSGTIYTYDTLL